MGFEDARTFIATKVSPEEAKKMDRASMYVSRPTPTMKEVEGQEPIVRRGTCPHCGAGTWVVADTHYWKWFTCWNCGGAFTA